MVRRPRAVIRNLSRSHRTMLTWLSAIQVMRSHTHSLWVSVWHSPDWLIYDGSVHFQNISQGRYAIPTVQERR